MSESVTLTGRVLETEHKAGEFEGRPYNFKVAHVLVGTKVIEVRFNPDNADARPPADGELVSLIVEVPKGTRLTAKRYAAPAAAAGEGSKPTPVSRVS